MKTLVIELHGLSAEMINSQNTPFIYNLKQSLNYARVIPPFGCNFYASLWTGKTPEESDYFTKYYFSKKSNLKKYWKFPNALRNIIYNLHQLILGKKYLTKIDKNPKIKFFQIRKKHHYFEKEFNSGFNFFQSLEKKGKKYLFYEHPTLKINKKIKRLFFEKYDNLSRIKRFSKTIEKNPNLDFHFLMLRDTDILGHKYGPKSKEVERCLFSTDKEIEKLIKMYFSKEDNIFIMTGYGMLEVKDCFNLEKKLPKFGQGYIYFLDSTMARFWFFNENKKKEVKDILKKINQGHLLSKEEIKELKIDFKKPFFFEELFLVNPGTVISPCFFHDNKIKGMHTYNLKNKKELGFVISNKKLKNKINTTQLHKFFN